MSVRVPCNYTYIYIYMFSAVFTDRNALDVMRENALLILSRGHLPEMVANIRTEGTHTVATER